MSNPSLYHLCFIIWLNNKIINTFKPNFLLPHIPHYFLPYKWIKPPIQIYSRPFHTHLCCFWIIKILPNRSIKKTNFFFKPLSLLPTTPLSNPLHKLHILLHIIIFTPPPRKLSNFLPYWNIKKGGYNLIWRTHKSHMHQIIPIHGQ